MPLTFFDETVTRIRPGVKTSRGSETPDWSNANEEKISGCHVQPSTTTLSQDGRVLGISEAFTLYAPIGSDVKTGDKVVHGGQTYMVTGTSPWRSPSGRVSNLQASLERWSG